MGKTSAMVWLATSSLLLAACGGGDDDSSPDLGSVVANGATPTTTDPGDATSGDSGDAGAAADLGAALEPTASFVGPSSFAPVGSSIAVSPTGDRVALMWIAETDFSTNLAIYDAASGDQLTETTDDRLDGALIWTGDDRIITFGNFGELLEWDTATLSFVSEIPLVGDELECSAGNGARFDPGAGALLLKSDSLCRIDVGTGETAQYRSEKSTTLLAVAIGGDEVYLRATDDAGELVLRVLDATTLEVISDEPTSGPNPVIAASANGTIQQESGGFGYVVQPSGRVVDFYTSGITTSAAGGYYVGGFDGGSVVISSADGSTIGTIGSPDTQILETAWSADDTVMAAFSEEGVLIFAIG